MAYIVEQKIKGNVYLYKVESYWDKAKKQPRQRRIYLGPKERKNKLNVRKAGNNVVSKTYGLSFFLNNICDKIGLTEILKNCFPHHYKEILALSYYELTEKLPLYLFEYWQQEHYLPGVRSMNSQRSSMFLDDIGRMEEERVEFMRQWIERNKPVRSVCYDITSISSYSTKISFIEWGYNRDKEDLPQMNLGVVSDQQSGIPLYYNIFGGSIVDVSTIQNNIKYIKKLGLSEVVVILDRGFFSTRNVLEMSKSGNDINFVQALPLSLKIVKEIIRRERKKLTSASNVFSYMDEILYGIPVKVEIGGKIFNGNVYYNEQLELQQKQWILKNLLEMDEIIKEKRFTNEKEAESFIAENIIPRYQRFYYWNRQTGKIEKNNKKLLEYFSQLGSYIIITNVKEGIEKVQMLSYYRNKDKIEKIFDILKNEIDGYRLRAHKEVINNGRLFIKFIALILAGYINNVMCKKKLYKYFTMREIFKELSKIKIIKLYETTPFISEISKKQKRILDDFDLFTSLFHSY